MKLQKLSLRKINLREKIYHEFNVLLRRTDNLYKTKKKIKKILTFW